MVLEEVLDACLDLCGSQVSQLVHRHYNVHSASLRVTARNVDAVEGLPERTVNVTRYMRQTDDLRCTPRWPQSWDHYGAAPKHEPRQRRVRQQ